MSVCVHTATLGRLNGFVGEIWYWTVIAKFIVQHLTSSGKLRATIRDGNYEGLFLNTSGRLTDKMFYRGEK